MQIVQSWLLSHPRGGTYNTIAVGTGLSFNAVQGAVADLHRFVHDFVISIPAPRNNYVCRGGWNQTAMQGEANQARHLTTRLESQGVRLGKAADVEPDPAQATVLRMKVAQVGVAADMERDLTAYLDTKAKAHGPRRQP